MKTKTKKGKLQRRKTTTLKNNHRGNSFTPIKYAIHCSNKNILLKSNKIDLISLLSISFISKLFHI